MLKEYSAWGAVQSVSQTRLDDGIEYIALYTSGKGYEYVGKIANVVSVRSFEDEYNADFSNEDWYDKNKVFFKLSEVYKLQNPIELDTKARNDKSINGRLPARQYFTLRQFKTAQTVSELFSD